MSSIDSLSAKPWPEFPSRHSGCVLIARNRKENLALTVLSFPGGIIPVHAAFFNDNVNDTTTTANPGHLALPIGDENNLIYADGGADTIISVAGDNQRIRHGAVKLVLT